ncbi:MAG: response regulator [Flaviaesturariibacter sp.]|nr:response regulator [Flaviaesturariibacter sp.]
MANRKYILYADDDDDDRDMMETCFIPYPDYTLLTFRDGQPLLDYLDQVKKEQVCLVVLDVNMPLLGGIATLQRLRSDSQFADLPIIIFTTSSSPVDGDKARGMNADVITKPVSLKQLEAVTARMIEYCTTYQNEKP